jgi:3-oxoadipate enol-lactonase
VSVDARFDRGRPRVPPGAGPAEPTTEPLPLTHSIAGDGPPVVLLNGGMMTFPSWEPVASRLRAGSAAGDATPSADSGEVATDHSARPRHCEERSDEAISMIEIATGAARPRDDEEDGAAAPRGYRTLSFDFRGQLLSPGAPPADLAGHARDVVALLDHVGWESAHLVAVSFGAEVAIELAAAQPRRVRSLVLVTAMDRETPQFRRGSDAMREILADVLAGGDRRPFYDQLIEDVYSEAYVQQEAVTFATRRAQVELLPAGWFAAVDGLLAALEGFDLRDRLPRIHCPALVAIAGDDRVMAPDRSRALAAALGAEVIEHPTAGHGLVAEDPAWLAAAVRDFLDRVDGSSRGR